MTAKPGSPRIVNNVSKYSKYYDQRRANYSVLFEWVKEAMRDYKGEYNIDIPQAEYVAYSLSKNLPKDVKLIEPKKPESHLPARAASINWPSAGCLTLFVLFFGAVIYFAILG